MAQYQENGLIFSVEEILNNQISKTLEIHYVLLNKTEFRKIDLSEPISMHVTDEFGNSYRRLDASQGLSGRLPASVYPGGAYQGLATFEQPVAQSEALYLAIDGSPAGLSDKIHLRIPIEALVDKDFVEEMRHPTDSDLEILRPRKRFSVRPGDVIALEYKIAADLYPPDMVYVISPNYVLEDGNNSGRYHLRIPNPAKYGPMTVVVMAEWSTRHGQNEILSISRSFTVDVLDPFEDCLEDCLAKIKSRSF